MSRRKWGMGSATSHSVQFLCDDHFQTILGELHSGAQVVIVTIWTADSELVDVVAVGVQTEGMIYPTRPSSWPKYEARHWE
jgi:hypothetical protein